MMFFDPVYFLFALPGLLLGIYAQMKLMSAYGHYVQVPARSGLSGAEAAREILDRAGLHNMPVEEVPGHLTDHYDPTRKALFLSSENYHGQSLAAVGVAAHEAGHALQHQAAYSMFRLRMALVPATQIATSAAYIAFFAGLFLHIFQLAVVGLAFFAIMTLFQLITLPVEFDASRRAKEQLFRLGLVSAEEGVGVKKVLNAAALTYVAAMVTAVLQLLYLVSVLQRGRRED